MSAYPMLRQWSDERAQLIEGVVPFVGTVIVSRRRTLSALHWRNDLIVTAAESIAGAERLPVYFDGQESDGQVIACDLGTDVAVLRAASSSDEPDTPQTTLQVTSGVGAQAGLRVGETVALVARSLSGPTAAWGNVKLAGPAWSSRRGGLIDQRLEFDVSVTAAFEGAAVLNMDGLVAAMAVPGPYGRVLGIPAATIESVVAKVEAHGHLPAPYLGIRLQSLWLDDHTRAELGRTTRAIAAVGGVEPESPAAQGGVQLGDLLLSLDKEAVEDARALSRRMGGLSAGQEIALEVLRGGKPVALRIRVGDRPRS